MRTTLSITGLQIYAYHGLFAEERRLGQRFRLNIDARLADTTSHSSDDLQSTVRYDAVIEYVTNIAAKTQYRTLEALAEHIGASLLKRFGLIEQLTVEVGKVSPPISHSLDQVSVAVELSRQDLSDSL